MRVLMVSTSYPADLSDWRGLFIRHLTYALARRDDLILKVWAPPGQTPDNVEVATTASEATWLRQLMLAGGIAHLLRTDRPCGVRAAIRLALGLRSLFAREKHVDLFHVNWLQGCLTLPRKGRPVLTTVLGSDLQLLRLPGMTRLLLRAFRGRRVVICPNAEWMLSPLQHSFQSVAKIEYVPFGIDTSWFELQRHEQDAGVPKWLCVSRLTRAKIGTLFDWCEPLFNTGGRELHLFGPMQEEMRLPAWIHYHGPATPAALCRDWFPVARGLITLSRHAEGRPQVMLEAMASGLPIVASSIAAHSDLLVHRETGWLCEAPTDLTEALGVLEVVAENRAVGARARAWAKAEVGTWDDCADRYSRLYRELLQAEP